MLIYTPLSTEIWFRGAILQYPRLHFCKSQQNNLKQKKLGNPFSYKLHLCQVLPCCTEQIVASHFSSLCFVPQLDKRFCKCYKMGSNPFRQTHTSVTCRAGCEMENSPHRGLPDQEQMLNEIWGFGYHEKPQALLDPCSAQKIRDRREKMLSYQTSCFLLLLLSWHPKVFHVLRARQSNCCTIQVPCLFFLYSWQSFHCLERVPDSNSIQAEQL